MYTSLLKHILYGSDSLKSNNLTSTVICVNKAHIFLARKSNTVCVNRGIAAKTVNTDHHLKIHRYKSVNILNAV